MFQPALMLFKIHQRPRPLREFEAVEQLVLDARHMAADQMANVQFGHFVVGQIQRRVAMQFCNCSTSFSDSARLATCMPTKTCASRRSL